MKINCITIEDEPLAEEKLLDFIERTPFLEVIKTFDNAIEAIGYLKENSIDLIFLDIQMKGLTGIQFMEVLKNKPQIIITSAYNEYALKCYEFSVTDYLLKPYSFERFIQAVDKALSNIPGKENSQTIPHDYIFIKTEYRIEKVLLNDILYVEGMKDYVRLITDKQKIMSLMSMKSLLKILPENCFVRTHKSFIVAINKIESIERNRIKIKDQLIPVGDTYKKDFYQKIGLNNS
ncbi:MAG: LytTR family DNA-binding domain-containing protein [Bacteroidales bacterium]|nr:LytTR family DNA-binding domain-containing protein [Bacteroidales bacterium]